MNDEWDFDSDMDMPPPPMDPAKARLNQTLAVLGGPTMEDFFDDGPKPEDIIQVNKNILTLKVCKFFLFQNTSKKAELIELKFLDNTPFGPRIFLRLNEF